MEAKIAVKNTHLQIDLLPGVLARSMATVVGLVRYDLTARQLVIFLVCSLDEGLHTVRSLAAQLRIGGSVVSRSADRLELLGLLQRVDDERDRRSVCLRPTEHGSALARDVRRHLAASAVTAQNARPATSARPLRMVGSRIPC